MMEIKSWLMCLKIAVRAINNHFLVSIYNVKQQSTPMCNITLMSNNLNLSLCLFISWWSIPLTEQSEVKKNNTVFFLKRKKKGEVSVWTNICLSLHFCIMEQTCQMNWKNVTRWVFKKLEKHSRNSNDQLKRQKRLLTVIRGYRRSHTTTNQSHSDENPILTSRGVLNLL